MMNIPTKLLRALALSVTPYGRAVAAKEMQHEQEILKVMTVLPGKHRYAQVEAAINASGSYPHGIYMNLASGQTTFALAKFYEALNGPK